MNWQKRSNPFVIALVRSPLHGLFETHTMLITLTGRTSGKRSTFPVSSVRDGETLFVISRRDRTWWKNLRSGAQVTVLLRGHAWQARGAGHRPHEGTDRTLGVDRTLQGGACLCQLQRYSKQPHAFRGGSGGSGCWPTRSVRQWAWVPLY